MKAVFDHSEAEADNIRTFFFKPERPIEYTAGQFTELTLEHKADKRGTRRWFTLSSAPGGELVSITTRFNGSDKSSSFKKTLFSLVPGSEVKLAEPMGDFVLPKLIQTPLIFVAGGIGITPFHSILEWLAASRESRPVKLIYAVKNEEDIIFLDTFERAGQHATIIVENASPAWGGERGKLSAEKIVGLAQPAEDSLVYVSGPEPMVETLEKDLKKAGIKKSQLVLDFFPNYPDY